MMRNKKIIDFLLVNGFHNTNLNTYETEKVVIYFATNTIHIYGKGFSHQLPTTGFYEIFGLLVYNRYVSVDFERAEPLK